MRYNRFGLFYNGRFQRAQNRGTLKVICPANGEELSLVDMADENDVELVVESAVKGFNVWRRFTMDERLTWMHRLRSALIEEKEMLIEALMRETGKHRGLAEEDFDKLQKGLEYYPREMKNLEGELLHDVEGDCEHRITYSPIGPVAAYLSWNFPLLNLGYKLGPVLAAGCSLIVKPSGRTPIATLMTAQISEKIGFPAGVINVAVGNNQGFGNGLSRHRKIAGITMIGSAETAKKVIAASATSIKRFSLELGGNAPFIVFNDGNLEEAADLLVGMKTNNSGQICVSPNRIYLHKDIHDKFINMLKVRLSKQKIGFPLEDPAVTMGPLISSGEAEKVKKLIDKAVAGGAKIVLGGDTNLGPAYIKPHLITGLTSANPVFHDEFFGPVIAIYSFEEDDAVLKEANDTDAGLASYIFTANIHRIARFTRELEFGEVMVNRAKWDIHLPHIGIKNSGLGVDCSKFALLDYLYMKRTTTLL